MYTQKVYSFFNRRFSLFLLLLFFGRLIFSRARVNKFNSIQINQRPYRFFKIRDTSDGRRMKKPLVQFSQSEKYQTAFIRSHVNNFRAACR